MIDQATAVLLLNVVVTPIIVLVTLWAKSNISTKERSINREDGFINGLEQRVISLEKEIREVRAELKNRDGEYLALYKEHTTLRAKYEILSADHEELKKQYDVTVIELANLKDSVRVGAEVTTKKLT